MAMGVTTTATAASKMSPTTMTRAPRLNIFEIASLAFKISFVFVPFIALRVLTQTITGASLNQSLRVRIRNAAIMFLMGKLSWRQIQAVMPATVKSYKGAMKRRGEAPVVTDLANARIMWIGGEWKRGGKVMLYFHGGGYVVPMLDDYVRLMGYLKTSFETANPGETLHIALLEYHLIPTHRFPTQLTQAVQALTHLVHTLQIPPSRILVGGDSAGGHLALSLLSHLLQPHPDLPTISLPSPLSGLLLISPATTFAAKSRSFTTNAQLDLLSQEMVARFGRYMSDDTEYYPLIHKHNLYYGESAEAPAEWWSGLENFFGRVLVTAGDREILRDDVMKLAERLEQCRPVRNGKVKLEVFLGEEEVHDEPLMDFGIGAGGSRGVVMGSTKKCAEFVTECLGEKRK